MTLMEKINSPAADAMFSSLYGADEVNGQRARFSRLVEGFLDDKQFPRSLFPEAGGALFVFTAAGRTELGGNHTDHNMGKVLAASIQLDAVAVAVPRRDKKVFFRSTGFPDVEVDISRLDMRESEKGSTESLIRGVAAFLAERGIPLCGWSANADSTVLPGSGLSSSAALEVLIAKIFDSLYNGGALLPMELARISQRAENEYFGKPSGLMDQAASASGGAVAIDFAGPGGAEVRQVHFDVERAGYVLCVVNTRDSHADLTPDYAAIPAEMRAVAAFFGTSNLREAGRNAFAAALANPQSAARLRAQCGDRALLRALHFFDENARVEAMYAALEALNAAQGGAEIAQRMGRFLDLVNESGDSSWELLQNVYSPSQAARQGVSLALALTRNFGAHERARLGCRVHGGGFAGTIQAYIPRDLFAAYKQEAEAVFGGGAVTAIMIRGTGVARLDF
jgi:galactokinase